jgi:enoyl-CoA hydratase/carnithine racemase
MSDNIRLETDRGTARIILDHPPLNVLSLESRRALFDHVKSLESRDDIHVVVIESALPRAFSVGSDLREFPEDELGGVAKIRFEQYLLDHLAALPQVVVAKLRGFVLGGGGEIMLACDLRIASRNAQFGFPEIKVGGLPVAGGVKRLVQEVGPGRARQLVLSGQSIPAETALAIGLITEVVEDDALDRRVGEVVDELMARPHNSLRIAKRTLRAALPATTVDAAEADAFGALYRSENLREGVAAFLEKREPRFNRPAEG